MAKYNKLIGTEIITVANFKTPHGVKFAPSSVRLKYKKPDKTVTNINVSPNTENVYTVAILLDVTGEWIFRWECTGDGATAQEFEVYVEKSNI